MLNFPRPGCVQPAFEPGAPVRNPRLPPPGVIHGNRNSLAMPSNLRDTRRTPRWVQDLRVGFRLIPVLAAGAWHASALQPIPRFPIRHDPLTITRPVEAGKPFTVAGERGAIFGEQSGTFEAWIYPVKILSGFSITAELADYPVPIDVTAHAAVIEVAPAMTTITYSHAAFTVKQHMFAARGDAGAVVLFEIDSVRPLHLTFRFKPEM